MLTRTQVLFEDWQFDYIKNVAERLDLSFSEICRMLISVGAYTSIRNLHPEAELKFDKEIIEVFTNDKTTVEKRHQMLSKLYFETRKAVEYRVSKTARKKA